MMTKSILSIIPARGGSKGLPRKNILDLAGKPLMAWTIEYSLKSKYITKTIVSSDDDEVLSVASEYGANIIKRPDFLSTETATSESVVHHVIESLFDQGEKYDIVVLLQPTSPLRNSTDIDNAILAMLNSSATSIISVFDYNNKILKAFMKDSSGFLTGISNNNFPFSRRQDLPEVYMQNGAIYAIDIDTFMESNSFMGDKTLGYVMTREKSIDIDSLQDLIDCKKYI
jgi:CMP-N,N'-diacetyllegionaminic acid synthase